ncbi:MAG: type II asparaginase [Acidobacteria bacterium]|nr:type II asparaginase [Acidobacteriota bacterium]
MTRRIWLLVPFILVVGGVSGQVQEDQLPEDLPHVRVVATGGTIAGRAQSAEAGAGYRSGSLPIEDLLVDLPGLDRMAEVSAEQFSNLPSTGVTPEQWLGLAQRVNTIFAEGVDGKAVDGVVVTHGTDALEETAYFLDLTVASDKPVVVVGAMRPPGTVSADGPINLIHAIQAAAADDSRGRGTLIVLNEEVHDARDATKTHTRSVQTFQSRSWGPLGRVGREGVTYHRRSEKRQGADLEFDVSTKSIEDLPRVDILYSYNGADGAGAQAFVDAGAAGLVIAGSGGGGTSRELGETLRELAEAGTWLVRTSRVGSGSAGSWGRGTFVGGDDLLAQKAHILLMVALMHTSEAEEIQRIFREY